MKCLAGLLLGVVTLLGTARADTGQPVYLLAIGNNLPPMGPAGKGLAQLRYADDDAAAFYAFASGFSDKLMLLSVLDEETQRRYPDLARHARKPTLPELRIAVSGLAWQIMQDRKQGKEPVVIIFYSGHGFIRPKKGPALALMDSAITNAFLYNQILDKLSAKYIHLFVDACHAEAMVRPRGKRPALSARVAPLTDHDRRAWVTSRTLERFPNVGMIIATATDQEAHEWDRYGQGVFTHEVLSGLRGGADVDGDRRIEYSELHAFLAAANREVKDPRGRLQVLVHPPNMNRRVALVDLSVRRDDGWLVGMTDHLGHFYVEDERGNRLLDIHAEKNHEVSLTLPSEENLFLRNDEGETSIWIQAGDKVEIADVKVSTPVSAARGSITTAFRDGLFRAPFGPAYYRGFADRVGAISVTTTESTVNRPPRPPEVAQLSTPPPPPAEPTEAERVVLATPAPGPEPEVEVHETQPPGESALTSILLWSGAGAFLAAAAVTGGLALDARSEYYGTPYAAEAQDARDRYDRYRLAFWLTAGGAAAATVAGLLLYPWDSDDGPSVVTPQLAPGHVGVSVQIAW